MEIVTETIGQVEVQDGRDLYLIVKRLDDDLSTNECYNYIMPLYWRDNDYPGAVYCTNVRTMQDGPARVIAVVEFRYNV